MNTTKPAGFRAPLLAGTWLLFTLGVALPSTLYLANESEFSIDLPDLFVVALPALLVCALAWGLLLRLVPVLRHPRAVALVFALAVLVWLQGSILVWQYGPLDGRSIEWEADWLNGVIDTTIWVSVLAFAMYRPVVLCRAAGVVPPAIMLMQIVLIAATTAQMAREDSAGSIKSLVLDSTQKFSLSADRNVIVIVLDATQSDIFASIIDSEESYRRIFDGFTYFPDAVAASSYTELAVPALLTGELYDNTVPKQAYMREAFLQKSIFSILKRNGFRVDIFPWVGWGNESIYFDASIADNLVTPAPDAVRQEQLITEKDAKEIIHLADLSLFRSAPHFVKPYIHNNQRWFLINVVSLMVPENIKQTVSNDDQFETTVFARQAASGFRVERAGDAFKYYHTKGAHGPLMVEDDLSLGNEPRALTRENYVLALKAALKGLQQTFDALRKVGAFDNTMIVVLGDHGSGRVEELFLDLPDDGEMSVRASPGKYKRNFRKDKVRGLPLVLVKRFGASGPVQVSDTPVSTMDLAATIAGEVGITTSSNGVSMFDPRDRSGRERRFAAFYITETKTSFVGDITLYSVTGHSWRDDSWAVTDILKAPAQ